MKRREFLTTAGGTAGAVGVAAASSSGAAAQEDDGGEGGGTTTVEMTDGLAFEPEQVTVAPGTTVVWENTGSIGHSVTAYEDEIPDDAEYWASGGFDSESAAREAYTAGDPDSGDVAGGETYEHTFETLGTHQYFCIPHEGAGMVGEVVVQEGGASAGPEIPEPEHLGVPIRAHFVGIGALLAIFVSLVYTFYVLKYGESAHASSPNRK